MEAANLSRIFDNDRDVYLCLLLSFPSLLSALILYPLSLSLSLKEEEMYREAILFSTTRPVFSIIGRYPLRPFAVIPADYILGKR